MLAALLQGKLGRVLVGGEGSEDLLTSAVLDACRYAPADEGWIPFLRRTNAPEGSPLRRWLARPGLQVECLLWPRWFERSEPTRRVQVLEDDEFSNEGFGWIEPDALLELSSGGEKAWLVLEAKLYSGKHNSGPEKGLPSDQLARQAIHLFERARSRGVEALGLLYVTAHPSDPLVFDETRTALCEAGVDEVPLHWLSWRSFIEATKQSSHPALVDARSALRDYWGLLPVHLKDWPKPPTRGPLWIWRTSWPKPPALGSAWTFRGIS